MALAAKNGSVPVGDTRMDYIRFGSGEKKLVMLPGLGDGLRTVKGTALPMALMYRRFTREFTVYAFSRREKLPEGFSTRDMARDLAEAMEALGISRADVLGVSMGGMIAQHLAADHPEKVGRLILTVTAPRREPVLEETLELWLDLARKGDHRALMDSNLERIYSEDYYRKNRWMLPVTGVLTKPGSYERFRILAEACRNHDAWDRLPEITAATLVVGGGKDRCLSPEGSRLLAQRIRGAELKMYGRWGHGLYEEAPDFNALVLEFLRK